MVQLDSFHIPPLPPIDQPAQLVSSTLHAPPPSLSAFRIPPLSSTSTTHDAVLATFLDRQPAQHSPLPSLRPPSPALSDDGSSSSSSTTASASSLRSSDSSIWHESQPPIRRPYLHHWAQDDPSYKSSAFISDHAYKSARDTTDASSLPEALLEHLEPIPSSGHAKLRPAPTHPIHAVLRSLLITATTATLSEHFYWDPASASYVWACTALHRRARRRRRHSDSQADVPADWWGAERIHGYSQPASDSLIRPFLNVATLLRRITLRLDEVRSSASQIKEAFSLAAALETVLGWLKSELAQWSHNRSVAILNAAAELEQPLLLLQALSALLSCSTSRIPPFRTLSWLSSTGSCLSHLHAHLAAAVASRSSRLAQGLLAFLLDRTSHTWRVELATWIGWPGLHSSRTGEMDHHLIAFNTRESTRSGKWSASKKAVPWSGAEIEWALDERGEEDVGYTLRPTAVPAFLSLGDARDFLEAGRALRLLKKAAPPGHPLVQHWTLQAEVAESEPLPLPTWHWRTERAQELKSTTEARVAALRSQIDIWRRSMESEESSNDQASCFPQNPVSAPAKQETKEEKQTESVDQRVARMAKLFDAMPTPSSQTSKVSLSPAVDELVLFLSDFVSSPVQSSASIATTLSAPLHAWSSLINEALINVFFRDLGVVTYLETCKRFLLLGSDNFERRVTAALFGDEGLSPKLTAGGVWPPNDAVLSASLNSAVIETVAAMRSAAVQSEAEAHALRDLDDRLSFAIVEPPSHHGRGWQDPQSIRALDWLTLSFHPPPLIAPLLTTLAQTRYQRLWNLLLRLKRVRVALRSAYARTRGSAAAMRVYWSARHFVDCLEGYVAEVVIALPWAAFMARLEASAQHSLRDVFSLARLHERVLDDMLEAAFLKQRQRALAKIIDDTLQLVLDFCTASASAPASASGLEAGQALKLGRAIHARVSTLVRGLLLVRERAPASSEEGAASASASGVAATRATEVEREVERQQADLERDLALLEGKGTMERIEARRAALSPAEILLTRLNLSGHYLSEMGIY